MSRPREACSAICTQQITSLAKLFIGRFYPFCWVEKESLSTTSKQGKKAALVCSCRGSPSDVMEQYAAWTGSGLSQIGAADTRAPVFDGIPGLGEILSRGNYIKQIRRLADWPAE